MGAAQFAQSVLEPAGPHAAAIEGLWWFVFWLCTAVFSIVMAALAAAVLRKAHRPAPETTITGWVAAGAGITAVILFVWLIASVKVGGAVASPKLSDAVTINVTGRQWWWQIEYVDSLPANRFRTANEIHVPVGTPVVVNVTSRDVIHSFWVPALHGKRDLIPGYTTSLWFQADRTGHYRGQCAEFCGHQHANMALWVAAKSREAFKEWLNAQRQPAVEPATDVQRWGRTLFMNGTCSQCHAIRGTRAGATFGPDLTHAGSRTSLGAGTLPNSPDNIRRWIRNAQDFKPGSKMPPHDLNDGELTAVAEYIWQLK